MKSKRFTRNNAVMIASNLRTCESNTRRNSGLPEGIDHGHYVEKVLRPIADSILEALDQSFDEALDQPRQLSLL